jgi:hypothetical protein
MLAVARHFLFSKTIQTVYEFPCIWLYNLKFDEGIKFGFFTHHIHFTDPWTLPQGMAVPLAHSHPTTSYTPATIKCNTGKASNHMPGEACVPLPAFTEPLRL